MSRRVAGHRFRAWIVAWTWLAGSMGGAHSAWAQNPAAAPLTLDQAIQQAQSNYPALKERRARAQAALETIGVARTAYLPRLDLLWQTNRATTNNVFGLLLPQGIIPPISGPVLGTQSYGDSVWGTAAGLQLSWNALDFGLRRANVDVARAQTSLASAEADLTQLDVEATAADSFLTALASDEAVRAAQANVDRLQVFATSVHTLVQNQLRPGADASRADAELAIARNTLSQAVQAADVARAQLANAIGAAGTTLQLDTRLLGSLPPVPPASAVDVPSHPAARAETAAVNAVQAREHAIDRSYLPHIDVQAALAGRGTGAVVPGQTPFGNGLSLQVPNWAVGASVTFPAFEVFTARARSRVELQNEQAERARYDQVVQALTTENARAQALVHAATEIARNTPTELTAATQAETQARARYTNGLADITEVAEAERLRAQAEVDDAVARIGVWRALLAVAQAHGDLTPFIQGSRQP